MHLDTFLILSVWLEKITMLKQSHKYFFVYQKLAIFLQIVGKGDSNRDLQETFQH